ncbi:MAG: hypothetical protein P9M06_03075 [Candidatus Saelkia tenebricola]|nr:hypothetical protein [Candidatus Saelkia tenebricola]
MSKEKEVLKRKISQIWIRTKKDLDSVLNETSKLLKNGEKHLKEISEKSQKNLELISLRVKKENLYYKAGKRVVLTPKSRWAGSKEIDKLIQDIKKLDREIIKLQKK